MRTVHIIRLIPPGISTLGYMWILSKKMRPEFTAGFVCSAITGCLFISGILNLLPETAVFILLGGLFCFGLCIKNRLPLKNFIGFWSVIILAGGVGLLFILYGSRFAVQDIFDHWGTVIRVLIRDNRFPNYLDKFVGHKTYPVGAACWIYYWVFFSGIRAEFFQVFAQQFLFLCMAVSLFPLSKNMIGKILNAAVIIMMICGNQELFSIQVDNILVITTLSAISFMIYYREESGRKFLWLSAWLVFLISVKSSGAIYALFVLIPALPGIRWRKTGILAGISAFTFLLWTIHTDLVFTNAAKAKHAVSLEYYRSVLETKNRDTILTICRLWGIRETAVYNRFFYILILAAMLIILSYFFRFREKILLRKLCVYSVCCYCIHELGLLTVYIVSMPLNEALSLAAYSRYHAAAVMLAAGILLIPIQLILEELLTRSTAAAAFICCMSGIFMWLGIHPNIHYLSRQDPKTLIRRNYFEQVTSQLQIPDHSRIMNFTGDGEDKSNYYMALSRYSFAPDRNTHITPATFTSWDSYDYVFVLTDAADALQFLTENPPNKKILVVMK